MTEIRREVEVDTKLAELYERGYKIEDALDSNKRDLARAAGLKRRYREPIYETVKEITALIESRRDAMTPWERDDADKALATRERLLTEIEAVRAEARPLNDEFAAKRWSRFFLVNNVGGHIHSSMECSTCNRLGERTSFSWLPTLSGLSEADAVEEHGSILCTVCYPSAPVEWTLGVSKREQADKDARAAAKAERTAAKEAKAITDVDGSTLLDANGWEINTLVTARKELTDAMMSVTEWEKNAASHAPEMLRKHRDAVERILAAIAAKTGEDAETIRTEHAVKAEKKAAKQAKEAAKWAAERGF